MGIRDRSGCTCRCLKPQQRPLLGIKPKHPADDWSGRRNAEPRSERLSVLGTWSHVFGQPDAIADDTDSISRQCQPFGVVISARLAVVQQQHLIAASLEYGAISWMEIIRVERKVRRTQVSAGENDFGNSRE